ncbi:hypothetical protein [Microtetraspora glauca]|uniref:ABC transporter permease n=1 Tax=Microtetraspora glauca TaxID=1996 RepID=A0ABV3GMP0_MICGL
MSAVPHAVRGTSRPSALHVLATNEARRLLCHPLNLLGVAMWCIAVGTDAWAGPRPAFTALTAPMTLFWGVPVFFAANLVTSSARRAGTEELLEGLPRWREDRTGALCLAALAPFFMGVAAQALLSCLYLVTGNQLERFPTIAELACGPLNLLGGCLLGIAVARWTPWPGAPLLIMIILVRVNQYVNTAGAGDGQETGPFYLLGFYADFALWGPHPYLAAIGFNPGSVGWHAVYLLGLCLGAGALAMLADSSRRRLWLAVGALAVVVVAFAGIRVLL